SSTGPLNDLSGSTTDVAGRLGRARHFDGSTAAILSAHDNPSLNPTAGLTVSAWVNSENWASGNHRILQKGDNDDQYRFMCESNQLKLSLNSIGTSAVSALPPLLQWHHLASTYDGAITRVYVDGTEVRNDGMNGAIKVSTFDLHIGAKQPAGVAGDHFAGGIDEVRLSGAARSAAWIRAEYLAGTGGMIHLGPEETR
ncbi:MAG TPA: LamG domain-containing protein, partial [bacterium]|nr:LamG domain-containing protein [bacterium]